MDKDYSHMAGKHIVIDGVNYFSNEYFGDGLSNGYVYKNEQAFCENPDEVCYIPEAAFSDATPVTIDGVDYYSQEEVGGYSRNDLKDLVTDEEGKYFEDSEGTIIDEEILFYSIFWCCPETRLNEIYD